MGLEFKTESERNPVYTGPSVEEIKIAELEKKLALHEQFLNDNGHGVLFDMYVDMLEGKVSKEDYNNFAGDAEFEEITE